MEDNVLSVAVRLGRGVPSELPLEDKLGVCKARKKNFSWKGKSMSKFIIFIVIKLMQIKIIYQLPV